MGLRGTCERVFTGQHVVQRLTGHPLCRTIGSSHMCVGWTRGSVLTAWCRRVGLSLSMPDQDSSSCTLRGASQASEMSGGAGCCSGGSQRAARQWHQHRIQLCHPHRVPGWRDPIHKVVSRVCRHLPLHACGSCRCYPKESIRCLAGKHTHHFVTREAHIVPGCLL